LYNLKENSSYSAASRTGHCLGTLSEEMTDMDAAMGENPSTTDDEEVSEAEDCCPSDAAYAMVGSLYGRIMGEIRQNGLSEENRQKLNTRVLTEQMQCKIDVTVVAGSMLVVDPSTLVVDPSKVARAWHWLKVNNFRYR
jgi:hypothetical protein